MPAGDAGDAGGNVSAPGEAGDEVECPTPGRVGDGVMPAGDEVLPAREADDKVLPAREADDEVLPTDDKVLPAREADDDVLAAGDSCDEFMAAPEAFFGVTGSTCPHSTLSTCSRYSGLSRLFATFMISPGMTTRYIWYFTLRGRPLPLIRWSRCSAKTSMAYAISLKAGCFAIFTSLYQADLLIDIG
jgi:hypothetical protein